MALSRLCWEAGNRVRKPPPKVSLSRKSVLLNIIIKKRRERLRGGSRFLRMYCKKCPNRSSHAPSRAIFGKSWLEGPFRVGFCIMQSLPRRTLKGEKVSVLDAQSLKKKDVGLGVVLPQEEIKSIPPGNVFKRCSRVARGNLYRIQESTGAPMGIQTRWSLSRAREFSHRTPFLFRQFPAPRSRPESGLKKGRTPRAPTVGARGARPNSGPPFGHHSRVRVLGLRRGPSSGCPS